MAENRINEYLESIADGKSGPNDPRTRDETMLAKIAEGEEVTEEARTRFQFWLKQIQTGSGGYEQGFADGYAIGRDEGLKEGYNKGYNDGESIGYDKGYDRGYQDGVDNVSLVSKLIEDNGTYYPADDFADGYSQVIANVRPWLLNTSLPIAVTPGDVVFVGVVLGSGAVTSAHINVYVVGDTPATSYTIEHFGNFVLTDGSLNFNPNSGYNIILVAYASSFH